MLNPFSKKTKIGKPVSEKKQAVVAAPKTTVKNVSEKKAAKELTGETADARLVHAAGIVLRPIVSEKGTMLSEIGKYLFDVNKSANRIEVKKAVERIYNVHVEKVNVLPVRSRFVRYGKASGWTKRRKKAIVQLRKGEKIEVSKGV
ncbi:MAG TPA: 50S ribosomal protein L23 [Patescibacteria group bacterium]|nr:50S ribosomal protein L23 [Patescibacteria group bacterium]